MDGDVNEGISRSADGVMEGSVIASSRQFTLGQIVGLEPRHLYSVSIKRVTVGSSLT